MAISIVNSAKNKTTVPMGARQPNGLFLIEKPNRCNIFLNTFPDLWELSIFKIDCALIFYIPITIGLSHDV